MNTELIERLAREAGMKAVGAGRWASEAGHGWIDEPSLSRFASLIGEECARIAENTFEGMLDAVGEDSGWARTGENSAAAIRAKFPPSA